MKISSRGISLLKSFEGYSEVPYLCSAGYWTIGYGHKILNTEMSYDKITKKQAEQILEKDIQNFENKLGVLLLHKLSQNQYDAVVSLVYNIGLGAFQASALRQKLNRKEYDAAAEEFLRWCYVRGRRSKGLLNRRILERNLFIEG